MMQMGSWKNWFQPHILERGRTYFDEGRVSDLERTEDGYTATVEGTEEYEVEILLDGDSIEDMICDCPYAEDGNACKHMAAVLFAVAAAEPSKKKAPAKKERLTPAGLVEKIPDSQLRPLLTELVSADEKLYRTLLLRYGETSLDECMKTLKKELASIGRQYAGRDGAIDYYHAGEFSEAIADHIQRQTEILLARNEPLLAFQAGMDALWKYSDYSIDDSNGDYALITDVMDNMCADVLAATDETIAEKIFDILADCVKSGQEDWFVQDFASQMVFSHFAGKYFDEKKLALVDEQIAALTSSGKKDYSGEYEMEELLTRRFDLMKRLSLPKEELDAFLERYTNYSDIRKLCVQQALDEGKTDEAIRLLEEGKAADRNKRGLVAGYSEWLMDLYEQQGRRDKLIAELEYHAFVLSSGGMEMLNRLKQACTPAQWIEYRERYLSGRNYHRLELMESEGLWERLMRAAAKSENLSTLDRYESALNRRYPNEMLEAYACILTKEAAAASNRKEYQELALSEKTQELPVRDRAGGTAGGGLAYPVHPPPGHDGGATERGILTASLSYGAFHAIIEEKFDCFCEGPMRKIIRNAIRCNLCGDIIESTYRHDFVTCKCGSCSVDGGLDYLRRGFAHLRDDFTELSAFEYTEMID